jgi:Protein of unknown function (DUF4240)
MRLPTALLAIVLVGLVAYLVGSRSGEDVGADPAGVVARTTAVEPTATASPRAARPGAQMDEASFWDLTAQTRAEADNDTGRQSELLEERLRTLPPQQIVAFQRLRHRLDERAYTWDLWGAAYVIEDGCSDDCFRDFRAYLISLGHDTYEAALRDPDSLATVVQDAETGDWENADSVAADAYENVAGEDLPAEDSDLSGDPRGQPWDDENQEDLVRRYPRLAERFR